MARFECGQQVRIMTYDEICALPNVELGLPFGNGMLLRINGFDITPEAQASCGKDFYIERLDPEVDAFLLSGIEEWWPGAVLEVISEPGTHYGFKVGDEVVFRDWEDMKSDGSAAHSVVNQGMCERFAGITGIIKEIDSVNEYRANIRVDSDCQELSRFYLDTLMFRHVNESESEPIQVPIDDWMHIAF